MWIDYSKEISIRNLNIIFNTDNQHPSIDKKLFIKMGQTHSNT